MFTYLSEISVLFVLALVPSVVLERRGLISFELSVCQVRSSQVRLYYIQRKTWVPHMNNKETISTGIKHSQFECAVAYSQG